MEPEILTLPHFEPFFAHSITDYEPLCTARYLDNNIKLFLNMYIGTLVQNGTVHILHKLSLYE